MKLASVRCGRPGHVEQFDRAQPRVRAEPFAQRGLGEQPPDGRRGVAGQARRRTRPSAGRIT